MKAVILLIALVPPAAAQAGTRPGTPEIGPAPAFPSAAELGTGLVYEVPPGSGPVDTGGKSSRVSVKAGTKQQPLLVTRSKPTLTVNGLRFKDLNGNGRIDPYEDWRLPAENRARDLVGKMTLPEKTGTMLIASNNPACDGSISPRGAELIDRQKMTRFILRARVSQSPPDCSVKLTGFALRGGYPQTPLRMARFTNAVQERLEAGRLGIPALFKDNPRNHVETDPRFGITVGAGTMSQFPKPPGLAAAALGAGSPVSRAGSSPAQFPADMAIIRRFGQALAEEWKAIGLRGIYGYTADLGTEPRWHRFHETFTEDADLMSKIIGELVHTLQGPVYATGTSLSPSSVALTVKHFPGGGPQELGLDPHYTFGKYQVYLDKTGRYGFDYHLRPFRAAIAAGAASIMPYYGVPIDVTYKGIRYDQTGMAFSKQIVTDLLRTTLGFKGNVNSDSEVVEHRGWGLESFRTNPDTGQPYTVADRITAAIRSGTDVISEFQEGATIVGLVQQGKLSERKDIDPAVSRLLVEQFQLGLFENPYVDADLTEAKIGTAANRAAGMDAQRRSIVLLQNRNALLPLKQGSRIYAMGFKADEVARYGFRVTDGNGSGNARTPVPKNTDAVLIKVLVNNQGTGRYRSDDPMTGGRSVPVDIPLVDPRTGRRQLTWGSQDPCVYELAVNRQSKTPGACVDDGLVFGGPFPWEAGLLALSDLARAESWTMAPSLTDIQASMREVGDPAKVVISIYFRNPYVLDDGSGVKGAGALIATFGVTDGAQLDVISGRFAPRGRLPFSLPRSANAVTEQNPDAPGYAETKDGPLFPFGFGLSY